MLKSLLNDGYFKYYLLLLLMWIEPETPVIMSMDGDIDQIPMLMLNDDQKLFMNNIY